MPKKFEGFVPPQEHKEEVEEIEKYLQDTLGEKYKIFTPASKELLYEIAGIESKDKFRAERTARFFLEINHCVDIFTLDKNFREFLSQAAGRGMDSSAELAKELIEKQFIKLKKDKEKVGEIYNKSLRNRVGNIYERFTHMVKELLEEIGGEEWRGEKWQHDISWKTAKNNAEKAKWETWEKETRPYLIARFAEEVFNSIDHYTLEKITLGEELLSDEEKKLVKREELTTDRMAEATAKLAEKFLENQFLKGYYQTFEGTWQKEEK